VQAPWLTCEPQVFDCATGISTELHVVASAEGLREGSYEALDALIVQSNGGDQEIAVRLKLSLTPRLALSPQVLRCAGSAEQWLQMENQGYGTLRVQVVPQEPWIRVSREEWTIKPGNKARLRVDLVDAPPLTEGRIEVRTQDQIVEVPILSCPGT
jgi:hypothetical protein